MAQPNVLEEVRSVLDQLTEVQLTAAFCLERLRNLLLAGGLSSDQGVGESVQPLVNSAVFSVTWSGRICHLGPTKLYRLFVRLLRRPNQYVSHDQLLRDVWLGDARSPHTVRSAVRNLKSKLVLAGMTDLAQAIESRGRHCGLMLERCR